MPPPPEVSPTEAIQDEKRRHSPEHEPTTKDDNPFIPSKSPIQSEPKIGSAGLGPLINPIAQQKRRSSPSVQTLLLFSNQLSGQIPPELSLLTNLQALRI
ncbi:hypothetical protein CASFOL_014964 [Castilleja foliolosa]|uniref:Uncharacterized protein n=1 Tax=Castilleja foliolosa TaxID=1961234 RepID=A0ABD3DCC2_9LAMI